MARAPFRAAPRRVARSLETRPFTEQIIPGFGGAEKRAKRQRCAFRRPSGSRPWRSRSSGEIAPRYHRPVYRFRWFIAMTALALDETRRSAHGNRLFLNDPLSRVTVVRADIKYEGFSVFQKTFFNRARVFLRAMTCSRLHKTALPLSSPIGVAFSDCGLPRSPYADFWEGYRCDRATCRSVFLENFCNVTSVFPILTAYGVHFCPSRLRYRPRVFKRYQSDSAADEFKYGSKAKRRQILTSSNVTIVWLYCRFAETLSTVFPALSSTLFGSQRPW